MTESINIDKILSAALAEDIGDGDVTTLSLVKGDRISEAIIVAKENFILAGLQYSARVFELVDKKVSFKALRKDGASIKKGTTIAKIKGRTASLLMAERTALNLLQRLSGIASLTGKYVSSIKKYKAEIADTRKTAPGLRFFDKYAVRTGGGRNHRYGLFDGILIKDNHITIAGGVSKAIRKCRNSAHHLLKIEVEVKNLKETREALTAGADIIMLDNMSIDSMKKAVNLIRQRDPSVIVEASGNVSLDNVRDIAATGVDLISVGALTHSARASDISLKFLS